MLSLNFQIHDNLQSTSSEVWGATKYCDIWHTYRSA